MVPTLGCMILFGAWGAWKAKRGKGKMADILQYTAAHAIFGMIVGVILAIVLSRLIYS
ncbi:MAG: hypothetical protein MK180_06400 [Rhodobacteraceae bacterium]|nr:hypothetical protein [Paracoccaceae bacterium]